MATMRKSTDSRGSTSFPGLGMTIVPSKQQAPDWQSGKSLTESLHHVFLSGIGSDVTFLVGAKRNRIRAHKLILTSRSPIYFAMFNGPMAETGDVKVLDISVKAFVPFLTYLYTDDIALTYKTVVPVMSVARKYCVDVLVSLCDTFLQTHLSPVSACFLLEEAHVYTEDQLMVSCLMVIAKSSRAVFTSESFANLCPSCLIGITGSDELAVDESTVYRAVMKWADKECVRQNMDITGDNKRTVLGNILFTIRFPIMTQDFFLDQVCADKILKSDEIVDILMHIRDNSKELSTNFNKNRRGMAYDRYGSPISGNHRKTSYVKRTHECY